MFSTDINATSSSSDSPHSPTEYKSSEPGLSTLARSISASVPRGSFDAKKSKIDTFTVRDRADDNVNDPLGSIKTIPNLLQGEENVDIAQFLYDLYRAYLIEIDHHVLYDYQNFIKEVDQHCLIVILDSKFADDPKNFERYANAIIITYTVDCENKTNTVFNLCYKIENKNAISFKIIQPEIVELLLKFISDSAESNSIEKILPKEGNEPIYELISEAIILNVQDERDIKLKAAAEKYLQFSSHSKERILQLRGLHQGLAGAVLKMLNETYSFGSDKPYDFAPISSLTEIKFKRIKEEFFYELIIPIHYLRYAKEANEPHQGFYEIPKGQTLEKTVQNVEDLLEPGYVPDNEMICLVTLVAKVDLNDFNPNQSNQRSSHVEVNIYIESALEAFKYTGPKWETSDRIVMHVESNIEENIDQNVNSWVDNILKGHKEIQGPIKKFLTETSSKIRDAVDRIIKIYKINDKYSEEKLLSNLLYLFAQGKAIGELKKTIEESCKKLLSIRKGFQIQSKEAKELFNNFSRVDDLIMERLQKPEGFIKLLDWGREELEIIFAALPLEKLIILTKIIEGEFIANIYKSALYVRMNPADYIFQYSNWENHTSPHSRVLVNLVLEEKDKILKKCKNEALKTQFILMFESLEKRLAQLPKGRVELSEFQLNFIKASIKGIFKTQPEALMRELEKDLKYHLIKQLDSKNQEDLEQIHKLQDILMIKISDRCHEDFEKRIVDYTSFIESHIQHMQYALKSAMDKRKLKVMVPQGNLSIENFNQIPEFFKQYLKTALDNRLMASKDTPNPFNNLLQEVIGSLGTIKSKRRNSHDDTQFEVSRAKSDKKMPSLNRRRSFETNSEDYETVGSLMSPKGDKGFDKRLFTRIDDIQSNINIPTSNRKSPLLSPPPVPSSIPQIENLPVNYQLNFQDVRKTEGNQSSPVGHIRRKTMTSMDLTPIQDTLLAESLAVKAKSKIRRPANLKPLVLTGGLQSTASSSTDEQRETTSATLHQQQTRAYKRRPRLLSALLPGQDYLTQKGSPKDQHSAVSTAIDEVGEYKQKEVTQEEQDLITDSGLEQSGRRDSPTSARSLTLSSRRRLSISEEVVSQAESNINRSGPPQVQTLLAPYFDSTKKRSLSSGSHPETEIKSGDEKKDEQVLDIYLKTELAPFTQIKTYYKKDPEKLAVLWGDNFIFVRTLIGGCSIFYSLDQMLHPYPQQRLKAQPYLMSIELIGGLISALETRYSILNPEKAKRFAAKLIETLSYICMTHVYLTNNAVLIDRELNHSASGTDFKWFVELNGAQFLIFIPHMMWRLNVKDIKNRIPNVVSKFIDKSLSFLLYGAIINEFATMCQMPRKLLFQIIPAITALTLVSVQGLFPKFENRTILGIIYIAAIAYFGMFIENIVNKKLVDPNAPPGLEPSNTEILVRSVFYAISLVYSLYAVQRYGVEFNRQYKDKPFLAMVPATALEDEPSDGYYPLSGSEHDELLEMFDQRSEVVGQDEINRQNERVRKIVENKTKKHEGEGKSNALHFSYKNKSLERVPESPASTKNNTVLNKSKK